MRPWILALGSLLLFGAVPCRAQVSLEVASAPGASLLVERLLGAFAEADPSLLTVHSSGLSDGSLIEALTSGRVDVAFVSRIPRVIRQDLKGMIFSPVAVLKGNVALAGPSAKLSFHHRITAIFPASPAPEVRAFLKFIASAKGRQALSEHGAALLTD